MKFKKIFLTVTTSTAAALLLAGCGQQANSTQKDENKGSENKVPITF